MLRTIVVAGIAMIAILTLSQCDAGIKAGAPKDNVVVVQIDASAVEEEGGEPSSMSAGQLNQAKSIIAAASNDKIKDIKAQTIFKANCATCHGFTGDLGVNGAKDLTASIISMEEAVAQVYFGKGLMTPFKGVLTDEEIVAVSKYTETLRKG